MKLAGEHKDTLTFKVNVASAPASEMPFSVSLYDDGQQHQLTDLRDGKKYWTAKIGDTIWMTQNLDYVPEGATWANNGIYNPETDVVYTDGFAGSEGGTDMHFSQGAYYTWNAAQTACPKGWILPEEKDGGKKLLSFLDNEGIIDPNYSSPFYFVRAGRINSNGSQSKLSDIGYLWSLNESTDTLGISLEYGENGHYVGGREKAVGLSVRCVAE